MIKRDVETRCQKRETRDLSGFRGTYASARNGQSCGRRVLARARWLLVGLGVLDPGIRQSAPPRTGPGAGRQPAPAGATRGLQAVPRRVLRPRWAGPEHVL